MKCFHCGHQLGTDSVHCESPDIDGLVFDLCWRCFEGYVYEGGFPLVFISAPDRGVRVRPAA